MLKVLLENEFGRIELCELSQWLASVNAFFIKKGKALLAYMADKCLVGNLRGQQPVFWLSDTSHYSVR